MVMSYCLCRKYPQARPAGPVPIMATLGSRVLMLSPLFMGRNTPPSNTEILPGSLGCEAGSKGDPAADVHRYAALVETQMKNQTFNPPPTTGLVQPYFPQLGV